MRKKLIKTVLAGLVLILEITITGCESEPPPQPPPTQKSPNEYLRDAAGDGNLKGVVSALQDGANVNTRYSNRNTPLIQASGRGHLEIVRYLIEQGADLDARNDDDSTALTLAVYRGHKAVARYLVDCGININARDKNGRSALQLAYNRGDMDIYGYLKEHDAIEFAPLAAPPQAAPAAQVPASASQSGGGHTPQTTPQAPASASQSDGGYTPETTPAPQIPASASQWEGGHTPQTTPTPQTPAPGASVPAVPTLYTGRYACSGSDITMSLGKYQITAYNGSEAVAHGIYYINGNQLVLSFSGGIEAGDMFNGKTFAYTITSSTTFSAAGEIWIWYRAN
jgi:hypothetical protein